jgi:hypothetical protein
MFQNFHSSARAFLEGACLQVYLRSDIGLVTIPPTTAPVRGKYIREAIKLPSDKQIIKNSEGHNT